MATGATSYARPLWITLGVIGTFHLALLAMVLLVETPLPQFLVQFDEQSRRLQEALAKVETHKSDSNAFSEAITATPFSLLAIEKMKRRPERELNEVFRQILVSWIDRRTEIFLFREGNALHNFAVYLESPSGRLEVCYREHDSRLIPTNRSWEKGDGHVGTCFLRGKTLFLFFPENHTDDTAQDILASNQPRPEDRAYYQSMVATPIVLDDKIIGVLIITSSQPNQFVKELHLPIVEVIGFLLAQARKDCLEVI